MELHPAPKLSDDRLAYDLAGLANAIGVGRSTVFRLIKSGAIATRKLGSRTLILREDAEQYLRSLPVNNPQKGTPK